MRKKFQTYLFFLLGVMCLGLSIVIAAAVIVDPYALYRDHETITGVDGFARIVKPVWVVERAPQIALAGSSRAEFLLDPQIVTEITGRTAFNIALSGANIYELRRNVEHVVAVAPIETVIVGLDFFMFNAERGNRPGFREERLAIAEDGKSNPHYWMTGLAATLVSRDSIDAVRRTIKYRDANKACQDSWTEWGGRLANGYECQLSAINGQQNNVRATLSHYLRKPSGLYNGYKLDTRPFPSNSMENIDRLVALAADERSLVLYISPVHALHLQLIEEMALWDVFEEWKRALAHKVAVARAQGINVVLWDLAVIGPLTSRPVFEADVSAQAEFYDSNHLRMSQKRRVLQVLLGTVEQETSVAVLLLPGTIEAHLQSLRIKREIWARAHPVDMGVLAGLVEAFSVQE
ncbi:MAG: hypothetical protein COA62_13900 [Rhodobiaceae bacterium]|nr:MAG: hypothetical protein COA62_13900 [Rhodobiaceae bacterium]